MVRIEPRNPPPPINFQECDGLLRICFTRKNKTLSSIFRSKSVLELLEKSYKVHDSLNNLKIHEDFHIKHHVLTILQESGKADNRHDRSMHSDITSTLLRSTISLCKNFS